MTRLLLPLALGAVLFASSSARALEIDHPSVSVVIAPEGGRICVTHPRLLYRTEDCQGYYDADPGNLGRDSAVVFAGIVSSFNAEYGLTIVAIPWVDPDTLGAVTSLMEESSRTMIRQDWGAGVLDVRSREYRIGDLSILEIHSTIDRPADTLAYTPAHLLAYVVAYDAGTLMVWADTAASLEAVRADVERTLRTARFTGADGAPAANRDDAAYVCGRLTGATLVAGLFIGLVVLVSRRSSKSRQPATPAQATFGAHREGKVLVVSNGAELGPVCVKCGDVHAPHKRRVTLWYYPPWILIFFLGAAIVGIILYYIMRQRVDLEVALCQRHQRRWTHGGWVGVLGALAFIFGALGVAVAVATEVGAGAVLVWLAVAAGGVGGVVWSMGSRITVTWADERTAKLRGVSPRVETGLQSVFE